MFTGRILPSVELTKRTILTLSEKLLRKIRHAHDGNILKYKPEVVLGSITNEVCICIIWT